MTEITLGVAIACGIVGVAALFMFRERVESVGRNGIKLRPPPPAQPQPLQLESMLATEQRHRDHETQLTERHAAEKAEMVRLHAETDAENQRIIAELTQTKTRNEKTIERLTASNAAKDMEIARLKEQIPKPPEAPRGMEGSSPYKPGSAFDRIHRDDQK